ncbi:MAG: glycosyl hydrolase, partial [Capnocytophaga ochracea]
MKKITYCIAMALAVVACNNSSKTDDKTPVKWESFSGDKNIERKVDSLLSLMTLEEKIGQLTQFAANWDVTGPVMSDDFQPYLEKGLVGSVFNAVTVPG